MAASKILKKLWNGGLNPATADPAQLTERRTVSLVAFVLIPSSLVMVFSHFLVLDSNHHRAAVIFATMLVGIFSLFVQAYKNWQWLAAVSVIGSLWLAPVGLMVEEGFSSTNWAWLLPVILLANFVLSRMASIVYTLLSVIVLILVSFVSVEGVTGYNIDASEHAITVAISGSLILVLACLLGYSYRTSQIQTQKTLRRSMASLAKEVDTRRTAELKARAGERAKATFLTTVSHELRTPLNGVIGASDLLSSKAIDGEVKELVDIIRNSGEILLDVINDVLDISRLDEGKLELATESVNLKAVVESCIDPLQVMANAKGLELKIDVSDSLAKNYLIDPSRIRQLILNVGGNAVKFTNEGQIEIMATQLGDSVKVSVRDTGIGIEEAKLSEIFSPFTQVDSSVGRQFQGSGLGLSIVERLVNLYDGEIQVESELGKGSCFSMLLPLQQAPKDAEKDSISTTISEGGMDINPATVLVTDDNLINRKVASLLLQKMGHRVEEAADGVEALMAVERGDIDIVLMDVQMPNMDGLTATSKIRDLKLPLCETPIIGVTANAFADAESEILKSGMNDYLSKPVRLDQLRYALFKAQGGMHS